MIWIREGLGCLLWLVHTGLVVIGLLVLGGLCWLSRQEGASLAEQWGLLTFRSRDCYEAILATMAQDDCREGLRVEPLPFLIDKKE